MRKIKFRAWDILCNCYCNDKLHMSIDLDGNVINYQNGDGSYILEQFTGLYDCDDKEIYEGDILLIPEGYCGDYHYREIKCPVKYDAPCFFVECGQEFNWCDTKIIGNIHEAKQ